MSATHYEDEINSAYLPSQSLWLAAEPLLPDAKQSKSKRGRPPAANRQMFFAVFYLLRSGIQWTGLFPDAWVHLPLFMTGFKVG